MGRFTLLVAAGLFAAALGRHWKRQDFEFLFMKPSKNITWVSCFAHPRLSCAVLEVPLDYNDKDLGSTNIAYIKYTSSNASAQDIIFNPGGPGASGIEYVRYGAKTLLEPFGPQYNLIGFDPRGVANSGPMLTCFPNAPEDRQSYNPGSHTVPLSEQYQRAKAYGEFCSLANLETEAKYAGSVATAQDIIHFIDANHAEKGLDGEAELWYYGVSYGTALGQTVAALYPERIGRMVLEGNVYGVEYYTGVVPSNVDDTDAAVHSFFEYCHDAGPKHCAFYGNSTTPQEMENRYLAILQNLRELPVIYTNPTPGVITTYHVAKSVFDMLYSPLGKFPDMAKSLVELEQGKANKFIIESSGSQDTSGHALYWNEGDVLQLITCLDVNKNYPIKSYEGYLDQREIYRKESYYSGDSFAVTNLLMCVGMNITPPESQQFPGFDPAGTYTRTPILFTNAIRDPITPLSSAHKMSALFPGSVVLAQNSTKHGIITSTCTTGYLQAYMSDASFPPPHTTCQPDTFPFIDPPSKRDLLMDHFIFEGI